MSTSNFSILLPELLTNIITYLSPQHLTGNAGLKYVASLNTKYKNVIFELLEHSFLQLYVSYNNIYKVKHYTISGISFSIDSMSTVGYEQITNDEINNLNISSYNYVSIHFGINLSIPSVFTLFNNLKGLELIHVNICDADLQLEQFSNLETLIIHEGSRLTDNAFRNLKHLIHLEIKNCNLISDVGLEYCQKLQSLCINNCDITDESLGTLKFLTTLKLYCCCSVDGSSFSKMKYLTELCIESCNIQEKYLQIPTLHTLKLLNCSHITGTILIHLPKLRTLYISISNISDIELSQLTQLTTLMLCACYNITDNGLKTLYSLKVLQLSNNDNITANAFISLTQLQHLVVHYIKNIRKRTSVVYLNNKMIYKSFGQFNMPHYFNYEI